jgi:hypothetical protein
MTDTHEDVRPDRHGAAPLDGRTVGTGNATGRVAEGVGRA